MTLGREAQSRRLVLGVVVAGTLGRLVLAWFTGLGVDESYAVAVARPFSLSYFDHPPLVFWLAGAGSALLGESAVLRLPFILLFAGTTWLLFRLGARLVGEQAGAYGAVAMNLAPFFTLSAGSWIVPDGPLMFSLVAMAYCLTRALDDAEGGGLGWWVALGVAGGCAGLSKYVAVFAALGVFGFLATSDRRWLARPGPWVALGVALVVVSPVLLWNATHGWASFRFQGGHTGVSSATGFHPAGLLTSVAGQALYFFPWIWLGLIYVLVTGSLAGPNEKSWLLCWLAVGPIVAIAVLALRGHPGFPHWAAGGYLFLFPLLGGFLARQRENVRRVEMIGSAAALLVLVAALGAQAATGAVSEEIPGLFRQGDPTLELVDWRELRPAFGRVGAPGGPAFAGAADWMAAGKLAYALGSVPVLCLGTACHHFPYRLDQKTFAGADGLLVVRPGDDAARQTYAHLFRRVDSVETVTIHRGERPAFELTVLAAHGFSPDAASP
ncbi:MAG TPA: glycosyltransferase family 39 protein [Gemmatimonadales bacterium]|nr:glycosyltransferase family 39 protein [Gemmatimonadales bacterium]